MITPLESQVPWMLNKSFLCRALKTVVDGMYSVVRTTGTSSGFLINRPFLRNVIVSCLISEFLSPVHMP